MRTSFQPTLCVLSIGLAVSLLGCSGATSPGNDAAFGGNSGSSGDLAGSGGAPLVVGGSGSGAGGGPSAAGTSGAGGSAGSAIGSASAGAAGSAAGGGAACDKSLATWTDSDDLWASNDYGPNFLRKNFWNNTASGAGALTLWAVSSS